VRVLEQPKETSYYDGFNEFLFREVPTEARRIVEVGCARGRLGMELKRQDPTREVIGIEYEPAAAEVARTRLDEVYVCDLQTEFPPIEPASVDCVIFGDVLEHLLDPEAVLRQVRELLTDDGVILVCVPNFTHYTILKAILRADPMYQPSGLLDATHIRFFSHATFIKMLLHVGLLPDLVQVIASGGTDHMIPAATPLLEYFGVNPARALKTLDAYQYIFKATKINYDASDVGEPNPVPITFVACVNDEDQLESNLRRSPCFWPGSPHELLLMREQRSAADGLAAGIAEASNDLVVLVQQDMYLPLGWDRQFASQFAQAEAQYGPIGVAGLFGIQFRDGEVRHVGQIIDRDTLLDRGVQLPAAVDVLDEVLLAVRRSSGLRADPELGFHLYGADLCLNAQKLGLRNVVLRAPAYHNSLFAEVGPQFHVARRLLLDRWPDIRPLYSNMGRLDHDHDHDLDHDLDHDEEPGELASALSRPDVEPATEVTQLRARLADAERRISEIEGTRAWRLRNGFNRVLGRG
jgi:SAM-dependent methyltransferase